LTALKSFHQVRIQCLVSLVLVSLALVTPAVSGAHFPLKVSQDGRYLVDREGRPFFVHGDTPWSLTHNLTYEEAVRYMENRRAKGFNALILSIPDAYAPDGKYPDLPDRYGNRPFVDRDVSRPNEPYWKHVDRVLAQSEELGFLAFFFPAYLGCCEDGYMKLFLENGPDRAREYGRWLGTRYRGRRNIVWVHGGDHNVGEAQNVVKAVREGIQAISPKQMHAVHWAPETPAWAPFGEEWIDIYTVYTYGPVAPRVLSYWQHRPVKPIILIETDYENDFNHKTADDVRKFPYRAVLSGAAGHFFGNRPLWFCGNGWQDALDSRGARYMEIAGRLFRSRPWHKLVPDAEGRLIIKGGGDTPGDDAVQAAIASDSTFAMAFLPSARLIELDLKVLGGRAVKVTWFSPKTGTASPAGIHHPGNQILKLLPPGDGDWVLILE